ncbi:hypothetical protein D3C80_1138270 [compost metagenome]
MDSAIEALQRLEMQQISRSDFVEEFSRSNIKREMAKDVLQISPKYLARSTRPKTQS